MTSVDVLVVGGGVGGMSAAALCARAGLSVRLLEAAPRLGGKAACITVRGAELDTGPSVLTLPDVLFDLFDRVGLPEQDRFRCLKLNPGFEYVFAGGTRVLFYHGVDDTLASVERSLGARARDELHNYLDYAAKIWKAAAPHFVFEKAPELGRILSGGPAAWHAVAQIDAMRSLRRAIRERVKTPELALILQRYATYNGSDARTAPATLGSIAHVEISLGGFGVDGGMYNVVRALQRCLELTRVDVHTSESAQELVLEGNRVRGVRTDRRFVSARAVILGADPWQWLHQLPGKEPIPSALPRSMSAYNAIFETTHPSAIHAPHTVLFPSNYEQEFADIFDRNRLPLTPTVYVCAQDRCHNKRSFARGEPLFAMLNAPALPEQQSAPSVPQDDARALSHVRSTLMAENMLGDSDECLWSRGPSDLAREFPGSQGALYGPASNGVWSAFRRIPNEIAQFPGLFAATGSAHPGGGVPLAVQSGKTAAKLVCAALRGQT